MVQTDSVAPACRALVGYVPVPTDWPEQQVSTVTEEISPEAKIHYETVDGGVKLMNVRIGQLAAGQEAKALVTVEICRNAQVPCEVSLETMMGCGYGVCLGCAVPRIDGGYLYACSDGPCVDGTLVDWGR